MASMVVGGLFNAFAFAGAGYLIIQDIRMKLKDITWL